MKELILTFACFIFLGNCYSQVLKIKNGIAINKMKGETVDLFGKQTVFYSGLLGVEYLQRKWFYLSSEAGYLKLGGKESTASADQAPREKQTWGFAHFNTSFRARVVYSKAEFYLGAGPYLNILLGSGTFDKPLYEGYAAQNTNWGGKMEVGINETINRVRVGVNCTYLLAASALAKSQYNLLDARSLAI